MSQWKQQQLDGARELFPKDRDPKVKGKGQVKEEDLLEQIGRLQMELEWIKESQLL